jgi:hypothetical protein
MECVDHAVNFMAVSNRAKAASSYSESFASFLTITLFMQASFWHRGNQLFRSIRLFYLSAPLPIEQRDRFRAKLKNFMRNSRILGSETERSP